MKKRSPISKIMTANIETVNHTNTLIEVDKMIKDNGFHHLPVVSGEKIIGMVSKSDIERITFISDYSSGEIATEVYPGLTIEQVMTKDVKTVQQNDTIYSAVELLAKNEFHALPVLDKEKVVGIVTTTDLMKYMLEEF
jgi:CBS domain-containing protein